MAVDEQDLRPDIALHRHDSRRRQSEDDATALSIDTIRALAIDAVETAQSGHPGTPMALAPLGHLLFTRFLKQDPADPDRPERDRFVLSAGHASVLLYALLHLSGYDLPLQELKRFRQLGSRCPGHPERGLTPGVEVTTEPLGQGFANAIGLAIAERLLVRAAGGDVVLFGASAPARDLLEARVHTRPCRAACPSSARAKRARRSRSAGLT